MTSKPTACIVTRRIGEPSQVWITRQIRSLQQHTPVTLTWTNLIPDDQKLGTAVECLPYPEDPNSTRSRWIWRARNAISGNFYGTLGEERSAICSLLERHQVDVVLAHFGHAALRILPAACDMNIPVVAHFHGLDISSSLRNRWYQSSLSRKINDFKKIVCVGSHQRDRLIQLGANPRNTHLIPCGVPTAEFPFIDRSSNTGTAKLLFVGRLVPWKGVHIALQALARLNSSNVPDWEFFIVGDGPQRHELQQLTQSLGLSKRVQFLGTLTPTEVCRQMSISDIFVHHSLSWSNGAVEGFGVSITEAASTGLPIIASRCGGIRDQVVESKTGILTDEYDVVSTAKAMLELICNHKLRLDLGRAGAELVRKKFDSSEQIKKLEQVMLQACASN